MPKKVTLKSYAKINLALKVLGVRGDGYHEIDSLMQSVSLFDIIKITEQEAFEIKISCNNPRVPLGDKNIAYKAALAFIKFSSIKKGLEIFIDKKIPVAAGLGGGSGNAAAVLFGLNSLFDLNYPMPKLLSIAEDIGSDVPFSLIGGFARVRGRGEVVDSLPPMPETWFVIVKPPFELSTKWVYEEYDKILAWKLKRGEIGRTLGEVFAPDSLPSILHNDLEEAVISKFPQIKEIKDRLIGLGALGASMSGSGPTVFGIAENKEGAQRIFEKLKKTYESYIAKNINLAVEKEL